MSHHWGTVTTYLWWWCFNPYHYYYCFFCFYGWLFSMPIHLKRGTIFKLIFSLMYISYLLFLLYIIYYYRYYVLLFHCIDFFIFTVPFQCFSYFSLLFMLFTINNDFSYYSKSLWRASVTLVHFSFRSIFGYLVNKSFKSFLFLTTTDHLWCCVQLPLDPMGVRFDSVSCPVLLMQSLCYFGSKRYPIIFFTWTLHEIQMMM